MNAPSSTITAAGLAALAMSVVWGFAGWLYLGPNGLVVPNGLEALTTGFVSSLVGYIKKEQVYNMTPKV